MNPGLYKRIFLYMILMLSISLIIQSQDIRNCKWKMTPRQVVASEKGTFLGKQDDALLYRVVADGNQYSLTYFFEKDSLAQAVMLYETKHSTAQTYYEKLNAIKLKLKSKYGQFVDETRWLDDLFKDVPKKYGLAASMGQVKFLYIFTTKRTKITLVLDGDNYECRLGIIYQDIKYQSNKITEL